MRLFQTSWNTQPKTYKQTWRNRIVVYSSALEKRHASGHREFESHFLRIEANEFMNTKQISITTARIALFVIYFWFGLLKVLGQSPASEMVQNLLLQIMPFVSFDTFIIFFGIFEMLIGILFIIPKLEKPAIILFFIHMVMTT